MTADDKIVGMNQGQPRRKVRRAFGLIVSKTAPPLLVKNDATASQIPVLKATFGVLEGKLESPPGFRGHALRPITG